MFCLLAQFEKEPDDIVWKTLELLTLLAERPLETVVATGSARSDLAIADAAVSDQEPFTGDHWEDAGSGEHDWYVPGMTVQGRQLAHPVRAQEPLVYESPDVSGWKKTQYWQLPLTFVPSGSDGLLLCQRQVKEIELVREILLMLSGSVGGIAFQKNNEEIIYDPAQLALGHLSSRAL
ncbi:hypothetical protein HDU91_001372, partial [Kappamyces sp. JEL0680]